MELVRGVRGAAAARPAGRWAFDRPAAVVAILLLAGKLAAVAVVEHATPVGPSETGVDGAGAGTGAAPKGFSATPATRDILLAGYISQPFYNRSDVTMQRPDGTDVRLKKLGWDGDALMPPIDGGIRSMEWWGSAGFMIDFLHNKAVARLGKGAHGRKVSNPVIDTVETEGKWKGGPAPSPVRLTDLLTRLEFTHGHNLLVFTPMLAIGQGFVPNLRPYVGIGAGFAIPHVEVWFPDEKIRTNEYQYAGPAAQVVAGLEYRRGSVSYILEYKFNYAWIDGALTGEESWKNFNMPGDLLRQLSRWWRGDVPALGTFQTTLGAHQIAFGAGWWWRRPKPAP